MKTIQGRTRTLKFEVTIGSARRVKSELDVNLLNPNEEYDGQPLSVALYIDIELFVAVLYVLCEPFIDGMGPDEFAAELPEAWGECRDAFFQEWIDFFRRGGLQDKAVGILKQMEAIRAAMQLTWERVREIDVETPAKQRIETLNLDRHMRQAICGNSSGEQPAF